MAGSETGESGFGGLGSSIGALENPHQRIADDSLRVADITVHNSLSGATLWLQLGLDT